VVTVPALGAKLTEVAKPVVEFVETCTPVGALITILLVDKSTPETEKVCGDTEHPEQVEKVFKVPFVVITGFNAIKFTVAEFVPLVPFKE
jgi:hypothetical protein